ncbi:MAG: hypothetical protein JSR89_12565 [Proteobacteria bacterium]|nr:hypothetical protein [Pseudomonadota bacterium]
MQNLVRARVPDVIPDDARPLFGRLGAHDQLRATIRGLIFVSQIAVGSAGSRLYATALDARPASAGMTIFC